MPDKPSHINTIVCGDDAISDYLVRLEAGQLTEEEQRVGASRKPKLWEMNHHVNVLGKDEYPDENLPND